MKKRGAFVLEALLRFRRRREEAARQSFGAAHAKSQLLVGRLAALAQTVRRQSRLAKAALVAGEPMLAWSVPHAGPARAVDCAALEAARRVEDRRREEFLEAMNLRKALSRLAAKHALAQSRLAERAATREIDDMYSNFLSAPQADLGTTADKTLVPSAASGD